MTQNKTLTILFLLFFSISALASSRKTYESLSVEFQDPKGRVLNRDAIYLMTDVNFEEGLIIIEKMHMKSGKLLGTTKYRLKKPGKKWELVKILQGQNDGPFEVKMKSETGYTGYSYEKVMKNRKYKEEFEFSATGSVITAFYESLEGKREGVIKMLGSLISESEFRKQVTSK